MDAEETLARTIKTSKDVSKLMTKAQMSREKAKASEIQVDQCSLIAEERQETYYKTIMPSVLDVRPSFFLFLPNCHFHLVFLSFLALATKEISGPGDLKDHVCEGWLGHLYHPGKQDPGQGQGRLRSDLIRNLPSPFPHTLPL